MMATLDDGTWHCMTDAPKDGTEVELLVRHLNFAACDSDEERRQWEQAAPAKWIDHNGGGWTWNGMCGLAVGWRPMPSNALAVGPDAAGGRSHTSDGFGGTVEAEKGNGDGKRD